MTTWKIIVPAVVVLVLVSATAAFALLRANPAMPDLAGMGLEQAKAALTDAGFAVGAAEYDPSSTEPTWTVIAQSVTSGERMTRGTVVDLTLAGAPPTDVPALVGLPRAEAESAVASATLIIGTVTESYDATVPAGAVISQDPEKGTAVPEGGPIALVVSKGREPVGLPDIVGKPQADAEAALKAAGFTVTTSTKDDKAAKGMVLSQKPAGGSMAVPGTAVTIVISTGVEMVKVPSWKAFDTTYSQDDWAAYLEHYIAAIEAGFRKAGLVPDVQLKSAYDSETPYQNPKAGSLVRRGTTVHVEIPVYD